MDGWQVVDTRATKDGMMRWMAHGAINPGSTRHWTMGGTEGAWVWGKR